MNAQAMVDAEDEAFEREKYLSERTIDLARANWSRLCKLPPSEAILSAIEIGLREGRGWPPFVPYEAKPSQPSSDCLEC